MDEMARLAGRQAGINTRQYLSSEAMYLIIMKSLEIFIYSL